MWVCMCLYLSGSQRENKWEIDGELNIKNKLRQKETKIMAVHEDGGDLVKEREDKSEKYKESERKKGRDRAKRF